MNQTFKRFAWLVVIVFSLHAIMPLSAQEKEKISPLLEKAIGQYKHENYEEALATLKKVRDEKNIPG